MTPESFIAKWSETTTKERAAAQEHFIDLCHVLGEKTPNEADPVGEWYAFEKGVEKTGAGRGWADVWMRGHFGWEYKSKSAGRVSTMAGALKQLQQYALALESPPLLIVSDIDTIEIHTAFQNAVQDVHVIRLEELARPEKLDLLRSAFKDPERLRPQRTRDQITAEAAGQFADLAYALRGNGHDPQDVAHFLNKILFCMFAEDVGILKTGLFTEIAEKGVEHPEHFNTFVQRLFQAMQVGGPFGTEIIDWFNGGLFDDDSTLPLTLEQIRTVRDLARMDWSQIEPAIFGTLFERGLDPAKRSQLGAHYTDPDSIMRLVNPTIIGPLLAEWRVVRAEIAKQMAQMEKVKTKAATKKRLQAAENAFQAYLEKLRNFRVLDPACGSGNFLYLALQALKDIEHRANIEAEALGLHRQNPLVGPEVVMGIEINAYAAELARVTVWIGEIQWMLDHGYSLSKDPILKPLDTIEQRDAILGVDGTEPDWPEADVIVGNPPFLGDKRMRSELGDEYVDNLRALYEGRISGSSDLVTYWFEKARAQMVETKAIVAGLVATNSIRQQRNRKVVERILDSQKLFNVWDDEEWVNDGADVRVSLLCFGHVSNATKKLLNDDPVDLIYADLTSSSGGRVDVTLAKALPENRGHSFFGLSLAGAFDVPGNLARSWLTLPNPNGLPNSEVLRPIRNGNDIMKGLKDRWVVDFGPTMEEAAASQYEAPFEYIVQNVKPKRLENREKIRRDKWWRLGRPRPELRNALEGLDRYIVTAETSRHRVFTWLPTSVAPEHKLVVFPTADDVIFGILSSRIHVVWATAGGGKLGVGNDPVYSTTRCFLTFALPDGYAFDREDHESIDDKAHAISEAAKDLEKFRHNWINPPQWTDQVDEVVDGYPVRLVPMEDHEADLAPRTLTNLYSTMPSWLVNAHQKLDEAVAAAYGWPAELSDVEILEKLLDLNLSRAADQELPLE